MRISEVQTKASVRRANKYRQFEMGALGRHRKYASELIDLWSAFIDMNMEVPAGHGRGARVTKKHIDMCWHRFQGTLLKAMAFKEGEEE
tara:strand:- start:1097 stop:1363 length:267 start_codon:yes stop_codon:yes gene_type:complete